MTHIKVEDLSPNGLERTTWGFWLDGKELVFDSYEEENRKTKRSKWIVKRGWYRLSYNNHVPETVLPRPELTNLVKQRAVEVLVEQLKIVIR